MVIVGSLFFFVIGQVTHLFAIQILIISEASVGWLQQAGYRNIAYHILSLPRKYFSLFVKVAIAVCTGIDLHSILC